MKEKPARLQHIDMIVKLGYGEVVAKFWKGKMLQQQ
jgi:hypothetical protein